MQVVAFNFFFKINLTVVYSSLKLTNIHHDIVVRGSVKQWHLPRHLTPQWFVFKQIIFKKCNNISKEIQKSRNAKNLLHLKRPLVLRSTLCKTIFVSMD